MKQVYALEPVVYTQPSVFLAGPTPRSEDVSSWRPSMVLSLNEAFSKSRARRGDYDVSQEPVAFIPEDRSGTFHGNYDHQTEWEHLAIDACDVLLFWVPRDLDTLPGFTTNVEFGYWLEKKKNVVLGYPPDSPKTTYLKWLYEKTRRESPYPTRHRTAARAVHLLEGGR